VRPFEYVAAETIDEALAVLAQSGDGVKVLAGGQSLVPLLHYRLIEPRVLVDVNALPLDAVRVEAGRLHLGALTRHATLEESADIKRACPLLSDTARLIGNARVRTLGTLGGSLVHADPAAELPAVCAAYDATIEIASARGTRTVPFQEFTAGFMTTAVEPDEIVTAVKLPLWPAGHRYGFHEFARRRGDFAIVGAAVLIDAGIDAVVQRAAIALCGAAITPIRLRDAEATLVGKTLEAAAIKAAAECARALAPISDIHASADYRRHLAEVLVRRALTEAAQRAGAA
jgi:aerobic carbon-monoxide dehydrogenase medium subunit